MSSPASIGKHPIHPMLVAIPIGLWIFSLVSDIVYLAGWGGEAWKDTALYALGGGIVGALLAAIPGLIDLLSIHEREMKRLGVLHMSINLIGVVIFALDFFLRLRNDPTAKLPVVLSVLGVIGVAVGGWLGGEMVYVKGMAVENPRPAK